MNQYLYSYVRPRLIKMLFIFKIALSTVELTNNSSLQVKKKIKWNLESKQPGLLSLAVIIELNLESRWSG